MEDFFEQNLGKLQDKNEVDQINLANKFKIDLLDGNDEEQEDLNIHNDDDDEVKAVKKSAQQHNFVSLFGLEDDPSKSISYLRKSRTRLGSKASGGVRSSIAGKFLMRKDTESLRSEVAATVIQPQNIVMIDKQPNSAPTVKKPKPEEEAKQPESSLTPKTNNFVNQKMEKEEEKKPEETKEEPKIQTLV